MRADTVAVVGNPSTGTSTVFIALTGRRQDVGNWRDATVERRTGRLRRDDDELTLVDLPGGHATARNRCSKAPRMGS